MYTAKSSAPDLDNLNKDKTYEIKIKWEKQ